MPNWAKHLAYKSSLFLTQLEQGGVLLLPILQERKPSSNLEKFTQQGRSRAHTGAWVSCISLARVGMHLPGGCVSLYEPQCSILALGLCFLPVSVSVNRPQRQNFSEHEDKIGIQSLGGYGLSWNPSSPCESHIYVLSLIFREGNRLKVAHPEMAEPHRPVPFLLHLSTAPR